MIDIITIRGTGEVRGVRNGMCGAVARKLDPAKFRLLECNYPATVGPVGAGRGIPAYPLDVSVDMAVAELAWMVRESPNRVGLISYSLGGIAATRLAEAGDSCKHLPECVMAICVCGEEWPCPTVAAAAEEDQ